jgi:hypothetical protein
VYGESRKRMRYVKSKVWVLPTQFGVGSCSSFIVFLALPPPLALSFFGRWGGFCSVLFLNSDRSRHPPHPCFKVLRLGFLPRRARLPSTSGMAEANWELLPARLLPHGTLSERMIGAGSRHKNPGEPPV